MGTTCEHDVVAWANEQAALLRAGQQEEISADAVTKAIDETGLGEFPAARPWAAERVLAVEFYPG